MWLAYPTVGLALLTLIFALWVRWWLRAFPVAELNYSYEQKYRRPERTNWTQVMPLAVMGMTSSSASAIIHVPTHAYTYDPHTGRRLR
jgi:hypothetical protein